jgi:hypothetical protein
MIHLWGKDYTRQELLRRVGDIRQLGGAEMCALGDGPEREVRVVRLWNAAGLDFAVTADRGLGLTSLRYRGIPLPFETALGASHPAYFEPGGLGWLRTFPGGFLTPCGLTQVGSPCMDGGEELGLHGRVSNLPASNLAWGGEWQGDEHRIWVEGLVRETRFFGENLALKRRVWMRLDEPRLWIEDQVENQGFSQTPHMFLQHINLGFPLVDAGARLELPAHTTQPRDAAARPGLERCLEFEDPLPGYAEQVFYHNLQADGDGRVQVRFVNPAFDGGRGLEVGIRYALAEYPVLVEWKMMGEGAYVVGLEPANCHVEGRCVERERGTLQILEPGESRRYRLEISFEG